MARAPRRRLAAGRPGLTRHVELRTETVLGLSLRRPVSPEELIDEDAFAEDEFLPYWAELWPASLALAEALPDVAGLRVCELGCGLGVPSLVAASRGAEVTATDWAPEAIELLRENAARNGLALTAEVRDWREPWDERFDLVLAADVLYEQRNVEPLLERLARACAGGARRARRPSVRGGVPAARGRGRRGRPAGRQASSR